MKSTSDLKIARSAPASSWGEQYLPLITGGSASTSYLTCSQKEKAIPDNSPSGVVSSISFAPAGLVTDVNVYIEVEHTWVGDLSARLSHQSVTPVTLFDRPGTTGTQIGCGQADIQAIFDDGFPLSAEDRCGVYPVAVGGVFAPMQPLSQFNGTLAQGDWSLMVADHQAEDIGKLITWCLEISVNSFLPPATPTPLPVTLPPSATIAPIAGQPQQYLLASEARAAANWAAFFGVNIAESEFFNRLPAAINPEMGFVGDPDDVWGMLPPDSYGIHAFPVAELLRDYGLSAFARRFARWEELKKEIAAGRPVIVWVTGRSRAGVYESGAPQYYRPPSEQVAVVVAQFERAVILTGYAEAEQTGAEGKVFLLDGSESYERTLSEFLASWSMLRNQAILAQP